METAQLHVLATPRYGNGIIGDVITHMFDSCLLEEDEIMVNVVRDGANTKQIIEDFYSVRDELDKSGYKRIFHFVLAADAHGSRKSEILRDAAFCLLSYFISLGYQTLIVRHYFDDDDQHVHIAVNPVHLWKKERLADDPETYNKIVEFLDANRETVWSWKYSRMTYGEVDGVIDPLVELFE